MSAARPTDMASQNNDSLLTALRTSNEALHASQSPRSYVALQECRYFLDAAFASAQELRSSLASLLHDGTYFLLSPKPEEREVQRDRIRKATLCFAELAALEKTIHKYEAQFTAAAGNLLVAILVAPDCEALVRTNNEYIDELAPLSLYPQSSVFEVPGDFDSQLEHAQRDRDERFEYHQDRTVRPAAPIYYPWGLPEIRPRAEVFCLLPEDDGADSDNDANRTLWFFRNGYNSSDYYADMPGYGSDSQWSGDTEMDESSDSDDDPSLRDIEDPAPPYEYHAVD